MRPYLVILIFFSSTVLARYHEKTRFDRSVHDEYELKSTDSDNSEKQWYFTDDITQFVVYKSKRENDCYLENIKQSQETSHKKRRTKILYASIALTKLETWRLAGGRIVDFCNGRSIILLQTTKPVPGQTLDPFLNEIFVDKNKKISSRRLVNAVLTPLINRTRRDVQFKQRKKLTENIEKRFRQRRQTNQFRGKFRGQTQSQYLNIGNNEQKEGKAEAEATQQTSHAVVSGSHGMGQAQSISLGGTGCEDCPGYSGMEGIPDKTRFPPKDGGSYTQDRIGITHPGTGVVPGAPYPGIIPGQITQPGGVVPGRVGIYPSVPGTGLPGTYPGSVPPGTMIPRRNGIYPGGVQPGIITPGRDGTYPGGVRPGSVIPGSIYPGTMIPGVHPGTMIPGGVPPGTVILGGDKTYPGGVRPGVTGTTGGTYIPDTLITGGPAQYPGSIQPAVITPGTVTGAGTYPGSIHPGVGQGTHPSGGVTTSVTTGVTVTGTGIYPGGMVPGISGTLPSGTHPGGAPPTGTGNHRVYPGTVPTSVSYPGGIVPGTTLPSGGIAYPAGPGGTVPGVIATTGTIAGTGIQVIGYPGSKRTDGQVIYPTGDAVQLGRIPGTTNGAGTQVTYPDTTVYPGNGVVPTTYSRGGQPQVVYPGTQQIIPSDGTNVYPGQGIYSGIGNQVPYSNGLYAGTNIKIPGAGIPGGIQYPIDTSVVQPTTGGMGITGYPGQYPDGVVGPSIGTGPITTYPVVDGGITGTTGIGDGSQYLQTGRPTDVTDDGADSQASTSVQQVDSGTQASASAQGRYGQGTAQSQVTGTYSGSGSFSAQAGTSDVNKSAQAEISGGKEGATSNAQGVAGYGKSQTQVQLDSDSGATSTGAQSSGWNHGTNSQVQASSKGGMADAQANGEGSTSSQAQIGFQPYISKSDEKLEKHASPFRGSGMASAQSGTYRGQSQSQLQGSFQYGITYTGAAQAGSGSGAASSRRPFNFTDTNLFKPFKPHDSLKKPTDIGNTQSNPSALSSDYENKQDDRDLGLQSSSTSKQTVVVGIKDSLEDSIDRKILATEKPRTDDTLYDEYDDEYADEDYETTTSSINNNAKAFTHQHSKLDKTTQQQNLQQSHQSQMTQVIKGDRYDVYVNQKSNTPPRTGDVLQPGQSLMGYTIPAGFRGRVTSISGTETIAEGDGKSQSQTVSLVPKIPDSNSTKLSFTETRSLQTNHERHVDRHTSNNKNSASSSIGQSTTSEKHTNFNPIPVAIKPSYYTVTNSVAGKMNGSHAQRQYEHRYYTKSSTCGYFTFSCNVVYGSNGRTKICKPKAPTYPNGTPMRC